MRRVFSTQLRCECQTSVTDFYLQTQKRVSNLKRSEESVTGGYLLWSDVCRTVGVSHRRRTTARFATVSAAVARVLLIGRLVGQELRYAVIGDGLRFGRQASVHRLDRRQ